MHRLSGYDDSEDERHDDGTAVIGGLQCALVAELTARFPERAGGTPQFAYRAVRGGSPTLGALSAWHLVNIAVSYELTSRNRIELNRLPAARLVEI